MNDTTQTPTSRNPSTPGSPAPAPVAPHHDGCPLCQPQNESLLWQDERLRIIHVLNEPGQPAYFRLIWQGHVKEMSDLGEADRLTVWAVLNLLEQGMRRFFSPDKINLASFGNQVPHLHWHIIGRWASDPQFPGSVWSPLQRAADSAEQQGVADRVATALPLFQSWLADQLAARQR